MSDKSTAENPIPIEINKPEVAAPKPDLLGTAAAITPVTIAKPEEEALSVPKPAAFDLSKLKSTGPLTPPNVKTLLPPLSVRHLKEVGDYVRLHPDEANYWSKETWLVSVPIKGSKGDNLHLITPELAKQYLPPARIKRMRFALGATPNGVFFLCEVPTQNLDNVWNKTTLTACETAKTFWTRLDSRHSEGLEGYVTSISGDKDFAPEPDWPTKPFDEIIGFSFEGRIIWTADHPGLLRLLGKKQQMS